MGLKLRTRQEEGSCLDTELYDGELVLDVVQAILVQEFGDRYGNKLLGRCLKEIGRSHGTFTTMYLPMLMDALDRYAFQQGGMRMAIQIRRRVMMSLIEG